jgi:hypothetical protein
MSLEVNKMEKELLERLWAISISVVEEVYPNIRKLGPEYFEGVSAILVREYKDYDQISIGSDEHVRESH